jgi:hypothetical protein
MSMLDWNEYRQQLMSEIGDLRKLSPTVNGYLLASGGGR